MRTTILISILALVGVAASFPALLSSAQAIGKATRSDILPVSEVKKGMKGYGLTVFEGEKPERFDVEVIDVLHNFRPRQEMILIKTDHPRLDVAKIVGGMSGSPVYLKDKMIGAYAYGWTFSAEPIAGVTPIRSMLDDLERPLPPMLRGVPLAPASQGGESKSSRSFTSGNSPASFNRHSQRRIGFARMHARPEAGRFNGVVGDYSFSQHALQMASVANGKSERIAALKALRSRKNNFGANAVAPHSERASQYATSVNLAESQASQFSGVDRQTQLTPVSTPLLLGGMTPDAVALAQKMFAPMGLEVLAGGGSGQANSAAESSGFVDGGSIGVSLVRGDMNAMGLGTVTRVEGNNVLGFGHPMMNVGVTALPTTQARILWFMASQMRSFKMGEALNLHGTLVNDRTASIVVRQDIKARTVPVHLSVKGEPGAPYTKWDFEIAHDPFMTPSFVGLAVGSGLQVAAAERRDMTYGINTRLKFVGYPEILIEDFGSMPTGTPNVQQLMDSLGMRAIGAVFNNPWEDVQLESVNVEIALKFSRDIAYLTEVQQLTREVEPGGELRVRVFFRSYHGAESSRVYTVKVPDEYAGRLLKISLKPGFSVQKNYAAPENLAQMIANLENVGIDPRSLVFSYKTGQGGAAHNGILASGLPPSALDTLTATHNTGGSTEFTVMKHQVEKLPFFLFGRDALSVRVRPSTR